MKKVLLATSVLAGLTGVAVAQDATTGVSVSGYGRFGIVHRSNVAAGVSKTQVVNRLRFNFDATTVTDSGVVFGARLRMQNDSGDSGTAGNNALFYTEYQGLRVEVGNVNTPYDTVALLWNSEMGYRDSSFGDPYELTYYYDSKSGLQTGNTMGIFASYSVSGFTGQISVVNPDQSVDSLSALGNNREIETQISLSYTYGQFDVAAAAIKSGAGIDGNDPWFIGAAYRINDNATVGLNYIDEEISATTLADLNAVYGPGYVDPGKTTTLYGNYKMDAITLRGYVAHNDAPTNTDDTAYGIGADYDLGGARLSGAVQRGYNDNTVVDLGVRFDF